MKNERQRNRIERKINESHFGLHRVSHVATRLALGFEYECATVGVSIIGPPYICVEQWSRSTNTKLLNLKYASNNHISSKFLYHFA